MEQRSFFGLSEHLERLSENGDPLETLEATEDFEYFQRLAGRGAGTLRTPLENSDFHWHSATVRNDHVYVGQVRPPVP